MMHRSRLPLDVDRRPGPPRRRRGRTAALATAFALVAVLTTAVDHRAAPTAAAAQPSAHSDWAPFVGSFQMWCTKATGDTICASHHTGWAIDVDLPLREPIHAAGPGTVVQVFGGCRPRGGDGGCNGRGGNWIAVDHGDHWSRYMHMAAIADGIEVGTVLQGGEVVGFAGASGTTGGEQIHLHYDETRPQNLPVTRVAFGPILACHGDTVVQYPDVLGTTDWQQVPFGTMLRNDGYDCLGGVTPTPLPPSATPPPPTTITPAPGGAVGLTFGDFGGNGHERLAIGVPGDTIRGRADAGSAIVVTIGRRTRTEALRQQKDLQDHIERDDLVGSALAAGDFDCDGRDDLAVGAPGEDAGTGLVSVVHGSRRDVDNRPVTLTQGDGLGGDAEPNDLTGGALAAGDFDGDGCDDLAIGAPGEDLDGLPDAGAVFVAYGSDAGIDRGATTVLTQGSALGGFIEAGDVVGATLAAGDLDCDGYDDLAVGAPGEGIDDTTAAGAVSVAFGGPDGFSRPRVIWQSAGLDGILESGDLVGAALAIGDFDGDGCDDLAVGAPGEDIDASADAGALSIVYGSRSGLSTSTVVYQGTLGLKGRPQTGDRVGAALAAGDFDCDGLDDLAVGAPGESMRGRPGAGWIGVVSGTARGLRGAMGWMRQGRALPGTAEAGDGFGTALAAGDANGDGCADLAIAAPGEDLGRRTDAGEVTLAYGSGRGLRSGGTFSQQSNLPGRSGDGDVLGGPGIERLLSL